jgi:AcrR family transcriptional regulator
LGEAEESARERPDCRTLYEEGSTERPDMAAQAEKTEEPRVRLSRDRVLRAAVALADEGGIESLTMRRLADKLGSAPMSLYYHVANQEALLDGVADLILREIIDATTKIETDPNDWKSVLRRRILAARDVLLRHPWAPHLIQTRTNTSTSSMRYFDSLIGLLLDAGFSVDLTHHALHALGSRALGFTQELYDDSEAPDDEAIAALLEQVADEYPHIATMVKGISHDADTTLGWCDDQFEFEFGLDLLLDGLERLRAETS